MLTSAMWEIMLPAFAECLVLTGLHAYLGLHVLRRKVIFVDLTLAQIAALGTTVGLLFGLGTDSMGAYILSLGFTLLGALVFTVTRMRSTRVPQEAIIGLVYALAAALAILVVSENPHGAKQVKSIMTGSLLWVDWGSVGITALVYGALGAIHWVFRRQFLALSEDPEAAAASGMSIRAWDFLFYATFGVAISLSVRTAGVLLVFVFLVVPAMVALLVSDRLPVQLVVGWTVGTVVTASGLALSYAASLPSGPTVVTFYGLILVPLSLGLWLWRAQEKGPVLRRIGVGTLVAVTVLALMPVMGRALAGTRLAMGPATAAAHDHDSHHRANPPAHEGAPGAMHVEEDPTSPETLVLLLSKSDPAEQIAVLERFESDQQGMLVAAFGATEDTALRVALARRVGAHSPADGAGMLVEVLRSEAFPFEKAEAADALDALIGQKLGYDPEASDEDNELALQQVEAWRAEL